MNPSKKPSVTTRRRLLLTHVFLMIATGPFVLAQATAPDTATLAKYDRNKNGRLDADELAVMESVRKKAENDRPTDQSDVVILSPFEVHTDTKGYYSANTMSGTRMNSKIEDLASSITVVTKEQMQDFAMLDLNDVFLYAAGTEGSGTYTAYSVDRNGSFSSDTQLNPTMANRVRGIAPANISQGNIETMGRTPVDPIGIDGIEISRGANSNVFGLGNPSGTVNMVSSSANLTRNRSQVTLRGDSYDGYRSSLDVNRVLIGGKLGVRGSTVFQHDGFVRKPSGVDTERYNGMIKYQPFKNTVISASIQYYHSYGTRPNFSPPRDSISYWISQGKPTWDPSAQVIHVNGTTIGPITAGTFPSTFGGQNIDALTQTFTGSTRSGIYVDQNGLGYWSVPQTTSNTAPFIPTSPFTSNNTVATPVTSPNFSSLGIVRFLAPSPAAGSAAGKIANQPLFSTTPSVSNQDLYDWTSINLSSGNWTMDRMITSNVQLDQVFFSTPRQTLAAQAGFMREDSQRYLRNLIGPANANGQSGQLLVDVNEKLLDGTPNPYFMRPYIGTDQPVTTSSPYKWDTTRVQAAYQLNLTQEKGWFKWLGLHQLTAYDEYKYRVQRVFAFRDAMTDDHSWLPAGTPRGNQAAVIGGPAVAPLLTRGYFRYYVGDGAGSNVDYAPASFKYGAYPFVWGGQNGVFNHENVTLGEVAVTDGAGAGANSKTVLKTLGSVLQSHFLNDAIVTTFGVREDKVYTKFGAVPQLNADGRTYDYAAMNAWAARDYFFNSGKTKSAQLVVRPFKDLPFVKQMAGEGRGAPRIFGDALRGLSFSINRSDSFLPLPPAQDLFHTLLPNSTGTDKTLGMGLNLFDGKFVLTVKHYETKQLNARNGDANTIASRLARFDVGVADATNFLPLAKLWVGANPAFNSSQQQIDAEVARVTGLSTADQNFLTAPAPGLASTNDVTSKGTEIELNFNPTRFWTVSANATEGRSVNNNVSPALAAWIAQRMPFWTSAIDTRTNSNWWTTAYNAAGLTPAANFAVFVQAPYNVIAQTQGKTNAQVRRYNFRLSTSYQLAGMTEHPILKRFNVGGAVRWEDKGAIGYYGLQQLPATITDLDPNRPIYDKSHAYFDAFITYRTKLFGGGIPASFQLNARNIEESGHLQPIGAFPDGTPNAYRIVDPRQFILQVTLDL